MEMRYQAFRYSKEVNGQRRQESVVIGCPRTCDLEEALHEIGLRYCMSSRASSLYQDGLTFGHLVENLTREMIEPYGICVIWPKNGTLMDTKPPIINPYELRCHDNDYIREQTRIRQIRDVAQSYTRRLGQLKEAQHPVVSTWDAETMADKAVAWASHFVLTKRTDRGAFFEQKLKKATPRGVKEAGEEENMKESSLPDAG